MYKVFFQIVAILLPLTLSGCLKKEQYKQKQLDKIQTSVLHTELIIWIPHYSL